MLCRCGPLIYCKGTTNQLMSPTNSSPYSSTDFQRAEIEPSLSALQQALALIQPELCMAASGTKSDHNGARSRTPPLQPLSGGDVIGIKAGVARHSRGALGCQVWISVAGPFAVPSVAILPA